MHLLNRNTLLQGGLLFITLFGFVLLVNMPIFKFDMMYFEQPFIYSVNQTIHSVKDLFHVYLHPKLLDRAIPFFRPSGHFLIYQLLTPLLGWHNTKGLLAVVFFFLAGSGFLLIQIYALLFPRYKAGGYIACGFYVMHPALIGVRLTIMHFDFAYVFFLLWSMYYFIFYVQQQMTKSYLLLASMLLFVLAVTFKEPAIMLGPVLACYLLLKSGRELLQRKTVWQTLLLLTVTTLTLTTYMLLPRPALGTAPHDVYNLKQFLGTGNEFLKSLLGVRHNFIKHDVLNASGIIHTNVAPLFTQYLQWVLLMVVFANLLFGYKNIFQEEKRGVVFLWLASLLFMVLPVAWAAGQAWHLSLSLACLALLSGFSCDWMLSKLSRKNYQLGMALALILGLQCVFVDRLNIQSIKYGTANFGFQVARNAIFQPPAIKNLFTLKSILVVEDSNMISDYDLGNSIYPLTLAAHTLMELSGLIILNNDFYLQTQPVYNGRLFRMAYLLPNLQEEVYPFQIANMQRVPDIILRNWLKHAADIFCVGYDKEGVWHDRTVDFRQKIASEKIRRHLQINPYLLQASMALSGKPAHVTPLLYPDVEQCQSTCDHLAQCKGFTYIERKDALYTAAKCFFYNNFAATTQPCKTCTAYIKALA